MREIEKEKKWSLMAARRKCIIEFNVENVTMLLEGSILEERKMKIIL